MRIKHLLAALPFLLASLGVLAQTPSSTALQPGYQIRWPAGVPGCVYAPGTNACVLPGGSPSGATNDVQFNNGGAFSTDTGVFTYNPAQHLLQGRAQLFQQSAGSLFNAQAYGADPTGAADSCTAITNSLSAAEAVNGDLSIPAGHYISSCGFTVTSNVHIFGAGMGPFYNTGLGANPSTTITITGGTGPAMQWGAVGTEMYQGPRMDHITFLDGTNAGAGGALAGGLIMHNVDRWELDTVGFNGFANTAAGAGYCVNVAQDASTAFDSSYYHAKNVWCYNAGGASAVLLGSYGSASTWEGGEIVLHQPGQTGIMDSSPLIGAAHSNNVHVDNVSVEVRSSNAFAAQVNSIGFNWTGRCEMNPSVVSNSTCVQVNAGGYGTNIAGIYSGCGTCVSVLAGAQYTNVDLTRMVNNYSLPFSDFGTATHVTWPNGDNYTKNTPSFSNFADYSGAMNHPDITGATHLFQVLGHDGSAFRASEYVAPILLSGGVSRNSSGILTVTTGQPENFYAGQSVIIDNVPALATVNITSLSESGTTVTATLAAPYALAVGNEIQINNTSPATYERQTNVTSVIDSTHFTYTSGNSGLAAGTGGQLLDFSANGVCPVLTIASTTQFTCTSPGAVASGGGGTVYSTASIYLSEFQEGAALGKGMVGSSLTAPTATDPYASRISFYYGNVQLDCNTGLTIGSPYTPIACALFQPTQATMSGKLMWGAAATNPIFIASSAKLFIGADNFTHQFAIPYESTSYVAGTTSTTLTELAANVTSTPKLLTSTGSGTTGTAPVWGESVPAAAANIPSYNTTPVSGHCANWGTNGLIGETGVACAKSAVVQTYSNRGRVNLPVGSFTVYTTVATALHRVSAAINCDTAVASATATVTMTYTDPSSTVQTLTGTATCTTLGSASVAQINQTVNALTGTPVTLAVAIASGPTYDVSATVEQLTTN